MKKNKALCASLYHLSTNGHRLSGSKDEKIEIMKDGNI